MTLSFASFGRSGRVTKSQEVRNTVLANIQSLQYYCVKQLCSGEILSPHLVTSLCSTCLPRESSLDDDIDDDDGEDDDDDDDICVNEDLARHHLDQGIPHPNLYDQRQVW